MFRRRHGISAALHGGACDACAHGADTYGFVERSAAGQPLDTFCRLSAWYAISTAMRWTSSGADMNRCEVPTFAHAFNFTERRLACASAAGGTVRRCRRRRVIISRIAAAKENVSGLKFFEACQSATNGLSARSRSYIDRLSPGTTYIFHCAPSCRRWCTRGHCVACDK